MYGFLGPFPVVDGSHAEDHDRQQVPQILALGLDGPVLRLLRVHPRISKPSDACEDDKQRNCHGPHQN